MGSARGALALILVLGASVASVAGDDGPQRSGGRLFGGMFRKAAVDEDSAPPKFTPNVSPERKAPDNWISVVKEAASHIETPGITWNLKPQRTNLKLRKVFYPLGITKLSVGADFNPLEAKWSMHTSWRDQIVGGDLQLQGSEISLTKDFAIDDRTALWLKGAFDWRTKKTMFGFKIRPGQGLSARVMGDDGPALTFRKQMPLSQNIGLEFDGLVQLPDAAYTTTTNGRISLGLGDFQVTVKEINLVAEV